MIDPRDDEPLERHYKHLTRLLLEGRVVPFLGAGANLCGRPPSQVWQGGIDFLPSAAELSAHLKKEWHDCDETELHGSRNGCWRWAARVIYSTRYTSCSTATTLPRASTRFWRSAGTAGEQRLCRDTS